MTQHAQGRDIRLAQQKATQSIPAFKNVALPALAAAVKAAKMQANRPKTSQLPAFLQEAPLD